MISQTIGERIKLLRKENGLTLDRFGNRIGIGKASVSRIESGENTPSDQTLMLICREFGVREEWLRTGEEPMYDQTGTFDLGEFVRQNGGTDLEIEIMKLYFELPLNMRTALVEHFRDGLERFAADQKEDSIENQVEEYRQQLLAERDQVAESQASYDTESKKA